MHPDHCQLPPAQPSPSCYWGAAKGYPRNTAHPGTSLPPPPADTEKQQVAGGGPAVTASAMGAGAGTWKSAPENPEDTLRLQPPGKATTGAGMGAWQGELGGFGAPFPSPGELRCSLPQLGHVAPKPAQSSPLPPSPPSVPVWVPQLQLSWKKWSLQVGGCPIFGVVSGIGREGT